MAKIVSNKRTAMFDEEFDINELGIETEAEKQMKMVLHKQLNTKISLHEHFSEHRTFISPSTFNSLTELVHGSCSLQKFKEIEKDEEVRQELQRCGLTNEEILTYLDFKSKKKEENRMLNPTVQEEIIQKIEKKIKHHNENLLKPQEFKNVKKLTRHEMEIENTLYVGCSDKSKLSSLVSSRNTSECDEVFSYIKSISEKMVEKRRKCKKTKNLSVPIDSNSSTSANFDTEKLQFDPNIHHVNIPLDENEINSKKLSIDEIRSLPRFENYAVGQPSKTLYLKNLQSKATVQELRSIFGQFEEKNGCPIDYKLCSGKMKGQAFIKFSNSSISEKALDFANGYMLRGKPIIIAFGKQS